MNQHPKHATGRLLLIAKRAAVEPPREIVVDGRKYRLVPTEGEAPPVPDPVPSRPTQRPTAPELLTARELQIVALVAQGLVNKQIAAELRISEWTVSTHLRRIYAKLDVDTRTAMITRCYALNLPG